jgi:hypothetical protein
MGQAPMNRLVYDSFMPRGGANIYAAPTGLTGIGVIS